MRTSFNQHHVSSVTKVIMDYLERLEEYWRLPFDLQDHVVFEFHSFGSNPICINGRIVGKHKKRNEIFLFEIGDNSPRPRFPFADIDEFDYLALVNNGCRVPAFDLAKCFVCNAVYLRLDTCYCEEINSTVDVFSVL